MNTQWTPARYRLLFWTVLAAVTAFRLSLVGRFGLGVDEAHYVMYARHLAWGYLDHPPLVGGLSALTALFGDGVFYVRLGPVLCWSVSAILLRRLALALYGSERVAFWSLVVLLLVPMHALVAVALLPDATLNLFWCAALLAGWRALETLRWRWWLLFGALFGGALLSKYHGVLLPLCFFCYIAGDRQMRPLLWNPRPYVAGLVGLLVFLPNILWNYRHGWVSYLYQLKHGGGSGSLSINKFCETFGGQLGVAGPILFILLVVAWVALIRRPSPGRERAADRFVVCMSLPVFLFFCGIGLFGKILPHWTAVGWWTGAICLVIVIGRRMQDGGAGGMRWRRWSIAAAVMGLVMVALLHVAISLPLVGPLYTWAQGVSVALHARFPGLKPLGPFKGEYDPTNDLYGWEEAARQVEAVKDAMPRSGKTFVFCHRFFSTSQLSVYLRASTVSASLHPKPSQYNLWFKPPEYAGWDALFVDDDRYRQGSEVYSNLFERIDREPVRIRILKGGLPAHDLDVYRCYGFKGRLLGEP